MSAVTKKRKITSTTLNNIPDDVFKEHIMPMSSEVESLQAELIRVKNKLKIEKASADYLRLEHIYAICDERVDDGDDENEQAMIDHYFFSINCDGVVIHSFKGFKLKDWPVPKKADLLKMYLLATSSKNLTSQSVYTCKLYKCYDEAFAAAACEHGCDMCGDMLPIVIEPADLNRLHFEEIDGNVFKSALWHAQC